MEKRRAEFGPNLLEEKKRKPAWRLFLEQFQDFMILILMVAALISGVAGEWTDTIIILVIIILNAILGFVQEYRAEKAMESLKKMSEVQANLIRNGKNVQVKSEELVPGDLVRLEAGNMIPADIQLLEGFSIQMDEASLTGESVPVEKSGLKNQIIESPKVESANHLFKGTLVTNGRGIGMVIATGMQTQLGKIADLLQEERPKTPLQERMKRFGKIISYLVLLICLLIFGFGILRGEEPIPLLLLSVSLAVAAIPEALPALITIALSLGAARLAKKEALIRKLPAVESLGSITYICTDKTGTLTKNQMTVMQTASAEIAPITSNYSNIDLAMALNHDIKPDEDGDLQGEATELALVNWVRGNLGEEDYQFIQKLFPRFDEVPFDSERKRMSTLHESNGKIILLCKGAMESILDACTPNADKDEFLSKSNEWAANGQRVLAFAGKILDQKPEKISADSLEKDLDFFGICGMIDPPREEAVLAIQECKTAGIHPVMITGDHPETAKAIAKEVGILESGQKILTGKEFAQLSDEQFEQEVEHISVYARVTPDQKIRIVKALQKRGHYVAMTGDGVNDAPSLRSSTIGVAMGITGTDVSKEAAHMILLDDNFATIVRAIREGRRIFDNIRKFVKYIMTCNGAEIWTIVVAPLLGLPIPLLPIHILWINLVTDGLPALALAGGRAEKNIMKRPPRPPSQSLFADGVGVHIIWVGLLMAGVTIFSQFWAIEHGWHWQTMVFTVLAFSQLGHVLAVRSEQTFLYEQGFKSNSPLLLSVFATMLIQLAVIYLPFFNSVFHTQALTLEELAFCFGMGLIVFHAVELEKFIKRRRKSG